MVVFLSQQKQKGSLKSESLKNKPSRLENTQTCFSNSIEVNWMLSNWNICFGRIKRWKITNLKGRKTLLNEKMHKLAFRNK